MAYAVSGLTDYVENKKDVLIRDVVLGAIAGDTIGKLALQTGIKTKERLNYLNADPVLQAGRGCGFTASGSTQFSERDIETAIFKVNDEWCPDDLLGKFAEYQVKFGADANAADMPFEGEIMKEYNTKLNQKLEKLVWQGDKSNGDLIDGFVTIAKGADSAETVNVSIASGSSVYEAIKAVIMAIPEDILDEAVVFVAPAIYRAFVQEMVEKNYFHFAPDAAIEDKDILFPGTSVAIHKTHGLAGNKRNIYASVLKNMVYGTDLMNDKEQFRLWFSDDNDKFRLKIKFNAGIQTLFPDAVVLGEAGSDLV